MALYVALCYYDRDQYWDSPPETEFSPEYMEFARRATEAGVMRGGEALHPVTMSTTITVSGGKGGDVLLVDGPYAEAKEVLGGYFLLEAADLDEAIAWAVQIPTAWRGKIELRPLAALKTIAGLEYSHLWHAALADNLRRLGHTSEAAGELHTAVTLAPSEVEQRLLQSRLRTVRPELG